MIRIGTLLIFGLLTSCRPRDNSPLIDEYPDLKEKIGQIQQTPKGNYYKFLYSSDSTCKIEWGNAKIKKQSTLDYHFKLVHRILYKAEDGNWLVLKSDTTDKDDCFEIICSLDEKSNELILVTTCE
jgi:hypothetical protein